MIMKIESYTTKLQEAISQAKKLAENSRHQELSSLHLLKAAIQLEGTSVNNLLLLGGVAHEVLQGELDKQLSELPQLTSDAPVRLAREAVEIFEKGEKKARDLGDAYVSLDVLIGGSCRFKKPSLKAAEISWFAG